MQTNWFFTSDEFLSGRVLQVTLSCWCTRNLSNTWSRKDKRTCTHAKELRTIWRQDATALIRDAIWIKTGMIPFLLLKHDELKIQIPAYKTTRERTADLHLNNSGCTLWNQLLSGTTSLSVTPPSLFLSGWESISLFYCQLIAAFDCLHLYSCVHSIYHLLLTLPLASLLIHHSSLIFMSPRDNFPLFILFMLH